MKSEIVRNFTQHDSILQESTMTESLILSFFILKQKKNWYVISLRVNKEIMDTSLVSIKMFFGVIM